MFGYVKTYPETLSEQEKQRYQAHYCGLCRQLGDDYGSRGRVTLTYDMAFLAMLLGSLYREDESEKNFACPVNPLRKCAGTQTAATSYAADMNMVLAWYKCLDDVQDAGSLPAKGKARLLEAPARLAGERWPRQEKAIRECLAELGEMERAGVLEPDAPADCFGRLLGELFVRKEDVHSPLLWQMGHSLGRFIYLMDAALDLKSDLKKERYNPLASQPDSDFTPMLMMVMAECALYFEQLPIERDAGILRNILYSGVWVTYQTKTKKGDAAS